MKVIAFLLAILKLLEIAKLLENSEELLLIPDFIRMVESDAVTYTHYITAQAVKKVGTTFLFLILTGDRDCVDSEMTIITQRLGDPAIMNGCHQTRTI